MANPAKFDRQRVVEQAMVLFWEKGFHATSMRHLQQVVDLRPGSLYAAFGSKEGLFREALQYYAARGEGRLAEQLELHGSPLAALQAFFYHAVIGQALTAPSRMCLLAKTVAELTDDNAELLAEARCQLKRMESAFLMMLQQARAVGELAPDQQPEQLAPFLQMQMLGLRAHSLVAGDLQATETMLRRVFEPLAARH